MTVRVCVQLLTPLLECSLAYRSRVRMTLQRPVLIVATKSDLSELPADGDQAASAVLKETDPLLTRFPVRG